MTLTLLVMQVVIGSHRAKHGGREGGTGWRASGRHRLLSGGHTSGTEEQKNPTEKTNKEHRRWRFQLPLHIFLVRPLVDRRRSWISMERLQSVRLSGRGLHQTGGCSSLRGPFRLTNEISWQAFKKRKKKERKKHQGRLPRCRGSPVLERKSSLALRFFERERERMRDIFSELFFYHFFLKN